MIPCGCRRFSLVEMLLNGPADHFALNGEIIHIAPGFSQSEVVLTTRYAQLNELAPFCDTDFANLAISVDGATGGLFEIVTIIDNFYLASHSSSRLDVKLNLGADDAAPVARRHQAEHRACCRRPRP